MLVNYLPNVNITLKSTVDQSLLNKTKSNFLLKNLKTVSSFLMMSLLFKQYSLLLSLIWTVIVLSIMNINYIFIYSIVIPNYTQKTYYRRRKSVLFSSLSFQKMSAFTSSKMPLKLWKTLRETKIQHFVESASIARRKCRVQSPVEFSCFHQYYHFCSFSCQLSEEWVGNLHRAHSAASPVLSYSLFIPE